MLAIQQNRAALCFTELKVVSERVLGKRDSVNNKHRLLFKGYWKVIEGLTASSDCQARDGSREADRKSCWSVGVVEC